MKKIEWIDYDRFSEGYSENYFTSFVIFENMEKGKICYDCHFSIHIKPSNGRIYVGTRKTLKSAKKFCEKTFQLI